MIDSDIPDQDERKMVLDVGSSFIVQAPAGAGKTGLLIQRYLALLPVVERPEQILAITFTRKAAGEMQARVVNALRRASENDAVSGVHDRETIELARNAMKRDAEMGWHLLDNPSRLRIQTIDSLCSFLVRAMPLLSGIGERMPVGDAPEILYSEAARRTVDLIDIDNIYGHAVCDALRHLDNSISGLEKRIALMLSKRDQWLRHISSIRNDSDLKEYLAGAWRRLVEEKLKDVCDSFPGYLENTILKSARFAAQNLADAGDSNPVSSLSSLRSLPGSSADALSVWQAIGHLLLTSEGNLRKPGGVNKNLGFPSMKTVEMVEAKSSFSELLVSFEKHDLFVARLGNVKRLPPPHYSHEEWNIMMAFMHLLPESDRRLRSVFRDQGVLDYQEISMGAVRALGTEDNPTELMLSMDLNLRHILVDEFQDTSRSQFDLLCQLTAGWEAGDGRTLFVVGDPMQSIYLFREAVVGLFLKARHEGIGNVGLIPITLKSNFRSQANLVRWFNTAFPDAFPSQDDPFTGAMRYEPSVPVIQAENDRNVIIKLFDDAREQEVEEIVHIIRGIDTASESTAILARARNHLTEIINVLKREHIPFICQDIDQLSERPVIYSLMALLRALMHPFDRTAWLAVLRSPWSGLTMNDIHKICIGDDKSPMWRLISDPVRLTGLSPDGRSRLHSFNEKMSRALLYKGRVPIRILLEGIWTELGGPACIGEDSSMDDVENFLDKLDSFTAGGKPLNIHEFENVISKLYASAVKKDDKALHVMTIHKAKGLEFDHVILPGAGSKLRSDEKRLLFWMEKGDDILLAPIERIAGNKESRLYNYLTEVQREKERLESVRLLYVAATRARKQLYIFGNITRKEGDIRPEKMSLLHNIRHMLNEDMLINDFSQAPHGHKEEKRPARRIVSGWGIADRVEPGFVVVKSPQTGVLNEKPEFKWAEKGITELGTLVHRYLHMIAREGLQAWDILRIRMEKKKMQCILSSLGLPESGAAIYADKCVKLLTDIINDDHGKWILADHPEGKSEFALTGILNGKPVSVVIDRTFVCNQIRWIIDYKISLHEGCAQDVFIDRERERYRSQLARYEDIFRAMGEKKCIKKALYYPALHEFVEL